MKSHTRIGDAVSVFDVEVLFFVVDGLVALEGGGEVVLLEDFFGDATAKPLVVIFVLSFRDDDTPDDAFSSLDVSESLTSIS